MRVHAVRSVLLGATVGFTLLLLTIMQYANTEESEEESWKQRNQRRLEAIDRSQRRILEGRVLSPTTGTEYIFMKHNTKQLSNQSKIDNTISPAKKESTIKTNSSLVKPAVHKDTGKYSNVSNGSNGTNRKAPSVDKSALPENTPHCKRKRALHRMENLFGDKFNPNLDPFMTISAIQSKNSKKYPLPFGVKGLGTAARGILEKLPNTGIPPDISKIPCVRCVVVGNGGTLHGSNVGGVIDGYDVVFRLNMAPLKGYEKDVGRKTSFRLVYPESSPKNPEDYTPGSTLLLIPFKKADLQWIDYVIDGRDLSKLKGFWHPVGKFVPKSKTELRIFNPEIITELSSSLIGLEIGSGKMDKNVPTSGAMAITVALRMCDEVAVAGFGYDTKRPDAPIHYYDDEQKMKAISASWTHNIDTEGKMLRRLVKQGVIRDLTDGLR